MNKIKVLLSDDHTVVPDAIITSIGEVPQALEKLYGWKPHDAEARQR